MKHELAKGLCIGLTLAWL